MTFVRKPHTGEKYSTRLYIWVAAVIMRVIKLNRQRMRWLDGTTDSMDVSLSEFQELVMSLIPGLGRSLGERNNNPLSYSCLRNPMDREAWQAPVHGVTKEPDTTDQLNSRYMNSTIGY